MQIEKYTYMARRKSIDYWDFFVMLLLDRFKISYIKESHVCVMCITQDVEMMRMHSVCYLGGSAFNRIPIYHEGVTRIQPMSFVLTLSFNLKLQIG